MGAGSITHNRTLLEKADLALSDLVTAGELLPAQAQKFIRLLIKESTIMGMATVKPMKSKKEEIPKIRFTNRVLHTASEATPLPAANRSKPTTTKVELDAKLYRAQVNLGDEVLEDNIEQGSLRTTVMELLGEAISRDMDEYVVQGDTSSADPDLATLDGMIVSATSNVATATPAALTKAQLKTSIKTMPSEFIRNKKRLRFLTSIDAETDLRDSYNARATVAGDRFLLEDAPVLYSGVPIESVPLFPENLGGGNNETVVILTDPKNICVGFWRKIRIETDKDVESGVMKVVASVRWDFKYIEETAVVKHEDIQVA